MDELKRKYEKSMRDVLHILGKCDYQYIKEYVEDLEKTFIQLEQNYDSLWDNVHSNPPLQENDMKNDIWIWDNILEEWVHVLFFNPNTKEIQYEVSNLISSTDGAWFDDLYFEENRFYRKQVEE